AAGRPREEGAPSQAFATLAAELAHELKNPLVAIKTFTQLLAEKFDDPEFREEFYRVVRHDVERIDHLVEGILKAAAGAAGGRRPTDLNELLDDVLVQSEPWMVERRVVAFKDLAEGLPLVLADPVQVQAALFNVVARALAALPPGEDLFLATRRGPPVRLVVTYRDSRTPAPEAAGAGEEVELALAREVLRASGGRLRVDRDPGQRTTVTIEFPER
ncbi:MAG TPA: histidine kinase dimerization/phospho-acceptor domain-containing protein, partial [Thermodesulfobacteriota bacterium]|nr:histidine kinase dimerization/phospho-acceptor domain-containing protein [Thermodesulfobacteriota bacterium]